jgi:hypothetical protein
MYSNASFTFAGTIGSRLLAGGIQQSSPIGGLAQLHLEASLRNLSQKTDQSMSRKSWVPE